MVTMKREPRSAGRGSPDPILAGGLRRSFEIPGGPQAPMAGRRAVDAVAELLGGSYDDVRLLVSELVTNAVRHAQVGPEDSLKLVLSISPERVRVEVSDSGQGFRYQPRSIDDQRPSGWGLVLVAALSDRWGAAGSIWFEMSRRPGSPSSSSTSAASATER